MACHIQIGEDPTIWWLAEPIQPSQLTQPLSVLTWYPIRGNLVLSPRATHVAIFTPPPVLVPSSVASPGIYLPTAAGVSAGHAGYELAGQDPAALATQIQALMHSGQSQTITLGGAGGTLVLNGATLPFAVTGPAGVGGATPHG
ncbi:MAG: hypothetical protein ACRDOA_06565 [Streptosporangiaceae bacterium]